MAIYLITETVCQTSQFNVGNIFQTQHFAIFSRPNNNIFKLLFSLQASFVTHHILERLIALLTELARSRFNILFSQCSRNIRRHQFIFGHYIRFQPNTHRVIGTHHHRLTNARHTFYLRHNIDIGVVFQEFLIVPVIIAIQSETHQHTGLAFLCDDTHLSNLSREKTLSLSHTVLDIDRRHIGIHPLFKINRNRCTTSISSSGGHIIHVLHTIDLLLKRSNYAVQYSLSISTLIRRTYTDCWRGNIRILFDRQRQ